MQTFEFRGVKLAYYDHDNREDRTTGFPIIFIHGAGSSHIIWNIQAREFSKTHRVIAIDLSGHNTSEKLEDAVDIENGYTREVVALIDHLDLQNFVLVGHSMGGGIVMSYVLNPEFRQPRAVVIVNTSSDLDIRKLAIGLAIEYVEEKLLKIKSRILRRDSEEIQILNEEQRLKDENPDMMSRDLDACDDFDITEKLGEIDVPTQIIYGEDDDIIRRGRIESLKDAIPNARLTVVEEADHVPMIERPEEFNAALREFLDWVELNT